ncbi:hypothetical protein ACSSS7_000923 [Eimeria intestinalis]
MADSGSREAAEAQWGEAAQEQQPTSIDPQRHLHYVEVSDDGLVATFVARGDYTDVGAVQADYPCPRNSSVSYFEAAILEASPIRPSICVGLCPRTFLLNRPPGIEPRSIGYRAEDGRKHCRKAKPASAAEPVAWEGYGPPYGQGDVVGCGILNSSRGVFFTKNGTFVGHAGKGSATSELFPTISMRHTGDSVKLNFAGPFLFNLQLLLHVRLSCEAPSNSATGRVYACRRQQQQQQQQQQHRPSAVFAAFAKAASSGSRSDDVRCHLHHTLTPHIREILPKFVISLCLCIEEKDDGKENGEFSAGDSESEGSGYATTDSQTPEVSPLLNQPDGKAQPFQVLSLLSGQTDSQFSVSRIDLSSCSQRMHTLQLRTSRLFPIVVKFVALKQPAASQDEDESRTSSKEDYEAVLISWPPVVPRRLAHSSARRSGTSIFEAPRIHHSVCDASFASTCYLKSNCPCAMPPRHQADPVFQPICTKKEPRILQALMEGRVSNAINLLQFHYPSVLSSANASLVS